MFIRNILLIIFLFATVSFLSAQTEDLSQPIFKRSIHNDTSIPLRDMVEKPITNINWEDGIIPLRELTAKYVTEYETDNSLQLFNGTDSGGTIIENFDGVPHGMYLPPDVSCSVGPNHIMQMVNVRYQIWDKSGNSLLGPFNLGTIWTGFPGPWSTSLNDGDPVVLYDEAADRWFASEFSLPNNGNGPEYILVAISQTGDPTGSWHRYGFEFDDFPDYPHYGVWPDAYYMSANRFGTTTGTYSAAFERDSMLVGNSAQMVFFSRTTSTNWSLLPSDWDGSTAPPAGAPNYFVQAHDNAFYGGIDGVDIQEFHVDWITPGNSTFGAPTFLATSPYSQVNGIPQLGTTQPLDDISDRMMQRLQYRNFGTHQSMVVCQTINAGGSRAGIRWYEFRNSGSGWTIYQEGTFAPDDGEARWMGSIAMNGDGDIALGYTASSSSINPEIRFTGRFDGDPLGVMTLAETLIYSSSGAQLHTAGRWGDYSQMSIDPVDDQTFWYSHEYIPTTGNNTWRTRIASFSFVVPPCNIGAASNPNPTSGTTDIPLDEPVLSWENGLDATEIEVIFNFATIYSGPPVTSLPMPPLSYSTTYLWQVNSSDGNCTTYGPSWIFTTMDDPNTEPLMSLTHTPGNLKVAIFNDGSIGAENSGATGPGITWLGVNGLYVGGVIFGSGSTGSVNGMIGSFNILDIQNATSNFAAGFTSDANFDQITEAKVNDGLAPSPYGVEITQNTYSNTGEEFVFIRYGFTNTTASIISAAVGGIFIDWDIDANSFGSNSGGYTFFDNVCYQFGTVNPQYYFGIAALDGASGRRTTTGGSSATIRAESYSFITTFNSVIGSNGDFRSWIGTALGDIGPGETVWKTFAIVAGSNLAEMTSYAIQANVKSASLGWTTLIVPVELSSFTANVNNEGDVSLYWSTSTELNNQMFEIERKSAESQYLTIGYVNGFGSTTEPHQYTYIDNSSLTGTYFYRLKQIDYSGQYQYSDEIEVEVIGPLAFELEQNYPNPFNPSTVIKYSISQDDFVTLKVFNLLGEKVATLVSEIQVAGRYEIDFDASNLSSGIYFYILKSGSLTAIHKMLLMK